MNGPYQEALEEFNVAAEEDLPAGEYPQWRLDELARKYAPPDAYEPDDVEDDE